MIELILAGFGVVLLIVLCSCLPGLVMLIAINRSEPEV